MVWRAGARVVPALSLLVDLRFPGVPLEPVAGEARMR